MGKESPSVYVRTHWVRGQKKIWKSDILVYRKKMMGMKKVILKFFEKRRKFQWIKENLNLEKTNRYTSYRQKWKKFDNGNLHWSQFPSIPPVFTAFVHVICSLSHWRWNLLPCFTNDELGHATHFEHRYAWGKGSVQSLKQDSRDIMFPLACLELLPFLWKDFLCPSSHTSHWCLPIPSLPSGSERIINMGTDIGSNSNLE